MKQFKQDISKIEAHVSNLMDHAETAFNGHCAYHTDDMKCCSMYLRALAGPQLVWQRPVIVISTVDVFARYQRKGMFKMLLAEFKKIATERDCILKVENVINPELRHYLASQGFWYRPVSCMTERAIGSMYWYADLERIKDLPERSGGSDELQIDLIKNQFTNK